MIQGDEKQNQIRSSLGMVSLSQSQLDTMFKDDKFTKENMVISDYELMKYEDAQFVGARP